MYEFNQTDKIKNWVKHMYVLGSDLRGGLIPSFIQKPGPTS